jgi:mannosyltransferase OCH1-like enzyme
VVHQTWVDNRFGRNHARHIEEFRDLNPDFTFRIWTDDERNEFVADYFSREPIWEIYKNAAFGPLSTDIWRYLTLRELGGWHFDITSVVLAPLSSLLRDPGADRAVITFEKNLFSEPISDSSATAHLLHPTHVIAN